MVLTSENSQLITQEHLYAISEVAISAKEWRSALDEISRLVHSFLIFDNLVVYLYDSITNNMEVIYARAMGRGKAADGEIAWGESVASEVAEKHQTIIQEPDEDLNLDRLERPYLLAIPLKSREKLLGTLVFVRFGGPQFTPPRIRLAHYIANQVSVLINQENLQQLYEKQDYQRRLQDDFFSTITHELRSPLGFIKGYTTTLLRSDASWDETTQHEFLEIIDQETDHLQELIDDLLDSARLQAGQMEMHFQPVRLDAMLHDLILRDKLKYPNLTITIDLPTDMKPIQADPRRLSQVFENLVSNAVKYAPRSQVNITARQDEKGSTLVFKDFGPGIPKKYLPLLFNRFFRNPEQSGETHGTGLGLFICKQIIQGHLGQINVDSTVGQGTEFTIFLPWQPLPL